MKTHSQAPWSPSPSTPTPPLPHPPSRYPPSLNPNPNLRLNPSPNLNIPNPNPNAHPSKAAPNSPTRPPRSGSGTSKTANSRSKPPKSPPKSFSRLAPHSSDAGALEYWLCAADEAGNTVLADRMTGDMMVRWASQISALTWSSMSAEGRMSCWCFRFATGEAYASFRAQFVVRMWETMHQTPWEKAKVCLLFAFCLRRRRMRVADGVFGCVFCFKPDEQIYFQESIVEDVEMKDVEDEDEEEDEDAVAGELEGTHLPSCIPYLLFRGADMLNQKKRRKRTMKTGQQIATRRGCPQDVIPS